MNRVLLANKKAPLDAGRVPLAVFYRYDQRPLRKRLDRFIQFQFPNTVGLRDKLTRQVGSGFGTIDGKTDG